MSHINTYRRTFRLIRQEGIDIIKNEVGVILVPADANALMSPSSSTPRGWLDAASTWVKRLREAATISDPAIRTTTILSLIIAHKE